MKPFTFTAKYRSGGAEHGNPLPVAEVSTLLRDAGIDVHPVELSNWITDGAKLPGGEKVMLAGQPMTGPGVAMAVKPFVTTPRDVLAFADGIKAAANAKAA